MLKRAMIFIGFVLIVAIAMIASARAEGAAGRDDLASFAPAYVVGKAHSSRSRSTGVFVSGAKFVSGAPDNIIIVPTAANIDIQVNAAVASKFQGFIIALKTELGYVPKTIHCYAKGGHVHNSKHYSGEGCDFDGSANKPRAMTHNKVRELAMRFGLRDGCEFHDCGHIDTGKPKRMYATKLAHRT